jgi:hypothetical protein
VHPLAQPRGNLGFPDDPSAQRRRGTAPENIARFNTHAEAPEPMAGALWTRYDASFPATWVEAMKKPSRAGGNPAKALGIELRCEPLDIFARENFFLALKTHANSKIVEPFDHRFSPSWIATLL